MDGGRWGSKAITCLWLQAGLITGGKWKPIGSDRIGRIVPYTCIERGGGRGGAFVTMPICGGFAIMLASTRQQ